MGQRQTEVSDLSCAMTAGIVSDDSASMFSRTRCLTQQLSSGLLHGQKGGPMEHYRQSNQPATIDGLPFSGHALDQMQGRGIPLSAAEKVLRVGEIIPSRDGTTMFYDAANNVRANQAASGRIITVGFGKP